MTSGIRLNINPGDRFFRLTIIKELNKKNKRRHFLCKCDCGTEKAIRLNSLTSGMTISCGCYSLEVSKKVNRKHGQYKTRLYATWHGIKARCLNKNHESYRHYGGRGIGVCSDWKDFKKFKLWADSSGYRDDLTIERINNDGNYEPSNCTWITHTEQRRNTTRVQRIEFNGLKKTYRQWASYYKMHPATLFNRLNNMGWTLEKSLTTPVRKKRDYRVNL